MNSPSGGHRPVSGRRPTIYDLARLAGASPTAVSVVLNGSWRERRIGAALAGRILALAEEQGYARNMQASALARERSHLIGMLVPKYDNRYFGSIVESFEAMARARGLFPLITCTQRDPALEVEAARAMIAHRVGCLVACGATDPDRITGLCLGAGVRSLNLDLPGRQAPSVISDNRGGARALTQALLAGIAAQGRRESLLFVGGRPGDHNTAERIAGFREAHAQAGLTVDPALVLAAGYAPRKAEAALERLVAAGGRLPAALFVNSTISLEGVMRWLAGRAGTQPQIGCFDWDPLVAALRPDIAMQRQDVPRMLAALFEMIDAVPDRKSAAGTPEAGSPEAGPAPLIQIPTVLASPGALCSAALS